MAIGLDASSRGGDLVRLVLGAGALALVPAARRPIDRLDRARVAALGIVWMAVPLSLFPIAQQWIDSSVAGMINGAVPITAALWATLLMRRLPPRRQLIGIAIGFVGMVAIFLPELSDSSATASAPLDRRRSDPLRAVEQHGRSPAAALRSAGAAALSWWRWWSWPDRTLRVARLVVGLGLSLAMVPLGVSAPVWRSC
jgi:hypothetical protein